MVSTRHQVNLRGRVLSYAATAGRLPIMDNETGAVHAWVFTVSYTLEGGRPDRPVNFAWNSSEAPAVSRLE